MLEPSNPAPSSNSASSSSDTGREKCCQVPGRSTNRRSMILASASLARRCTSAGVLDIAASGVIPPNADWRRLAGRLNDAVLEHEPTQRFDEWLPIKGHEIEPAIGDLLGRRAGEFRAARLLRRRRA